MSLSQNKDAVVLIGMPGVGKSTIGVLLAKCLSKPFLDTDVWIQSEEKSRLQEILDTVGQRAFCALEERYLCAIPPDPLVVATGGSAVYSDKAMKHLKTFGILVHLFLPFDELRSRLSNWTMRGIVIGKDKTLEDLFEERLPLYERYADVTVICSGLNHEEVLSKTLNTLKEYGYGSGGTSGNTCCG